MKRKNIAVICVLTIISIVLTWFFLPEKFYELISNIIGIDFFVANIGIMQEEKMKTLFAVCFGIFILITSRYKYLLKSLPFILLAFLCIFFWLLAGFIINCLLHGTHENGKYFIDISNCTKMVVLFPVIALGLLVLMMVGNRVMCDRSQMEK